jgi:anti-anti-sigma regulatory factor
VLRILQATAVDGSVLLRLEGKVSGPWVDELSKLSSQILQKPATRLALDLSEVSFIDANGLELLRELLSRSVSLSSCSLLVAQQLKSSEEVR